MSVRVDSPRSGEDDQLRDTAAPRPTTRVVVRYEPSARGRAALLHAFHLARGGELPLTVVSVATKEPVNVGCARCRHSAAVWNAEMRAVAEDELAEAARILGSSPAVDYAVVAGRPAQAIGEAADHAGADVVVVPWEPGGRVRRLFASTVAEDLRRLGCWQVIVAPADIQADAGPLQAGLTSR
jgi:hypothetical protein